MITVDMYEKHFTPASFGEDGNTPSEDGRWKLRAFVITDVGSYDGPYWFDGRFDDTDAMLIAQITALYQ